MKAIFKREFKAYFSSPVGYTVLAVLLFWGGLQYAMTFSGGLADMTGVFSSLTIVTFIVAPLMTMRLFSEEKRQKTDQLLLTAPVSIRAIVLGKFLAATAFFGVFILVLCVYNFLFYFFGGAPDLTVFLGNVVGTLLFAGAFIAVGVFISVLTDNQIVAAVCSFGAFLLLLSPSIITGWFRNEAVNRVSDWISFQNRYLPFTQGMFDIADFVYFLSIISAFLFLTVRAIDKKRWS